VSRSRDSGAENEIKKIYARADTPAGNRAGDQIN
jgi:hypothetical protein